MERKQICIIRIKKHKCFRSLKLTIKHCDNLKTLPWEHHIGCQMCQIALHKSTEKVFFYSSDRSDSCQNNHATSPQKSLATFFFYFLSTFGKSNSTHLTTDAMFSGQLFAIRLTLLLRDFMIHCMKRLHDCWVKRLHDFLCEEVFFRKKNSFLVKTVFW